MSLIRRLGVSALLLTCAVSVACGAGTPTVGATPSAPPPPPTTSVPTTRDPLTEPDSPRRIIYDPTLVTEPLPKATRVTMTAREAVRIAKAQTAISTDQQPGEPEATLRMVYAGVPSAGRRITGRPNWVLTWDDSEPAVRGPVTMSKEERRRIAAELECVFVVTVDPTTAKSTNAVQLCVRK